MRYFAGVDLELLYNALCSTTDERKAFISKCCTYISDHCNKQSKMAVKSAEEDSLPVINTVVADLKQLIQLQNSMDQTNLYFIYHRDLYKKIKEALSPDTGSTQNIALQVDKAHALGKRLAFYAQILGVFKYTAPENDNLRKLHDLALCQMRKLIHALLAEPDPNPDPDPARSAPRPQLRQDWLCALANTSQSSYSLQNLKAGSGG